MVRTQIMLDEVQYIALKRLADERGTSMGELIRRAVSAQYLDQSTDASAIDAAFGAWSDRDEDGATYVDRLRGSLADRIGR